MGQASAQREPSMEEILASIRRIIENNDPADTVSAEQDHTHDGLDTAEAVQPEPTEDVAEMQTAAEGYEDTGSKDANRSFEPDLTEDDPIEDNQVIEKNAVDEDSNAEPTISLADVAARVRSAPETGSAAVQVSERSAVEQIAAIIPAAVNDDLATDIDDAATEELRQALVSDEPVDSQIGGIPATKEHEVPHAAGTKADSGEPELETPAPADDRDDGSAQDQAGQLVSLQTGEKVAAAFGELSAAMAAGQTRSFDEIAEEMLKPMLTQWLDDNLPTLVERLVREEIERVSRGNRV